MNFEVSFTVGLDARLLNAGSRRRHFLGVSRLGDRHQVRTLGNVLFGELDGDLVLAFHTGHVDAGIGSQTVVVS